MNKQAHFKWNSGHYAILCEECGGIVKTGIEFNEKERLAMKGLERLEAQYCNECKNK